MHSSKLSSNVSSQELTLVKLSRRSLDFQYIPNKYLECIIQITNISNSAVAFKFKSPNPQQYLLTPSSSIIQPQKEMKISVKMHPDLFKNGLNTFKDSMQLIFAKIHNEVITQISYFLKTSFEYFPAQKETLENIFKKNVGVIEIETTKLLVKILSDNGQVLNNTSSSLSHSRQFSSPLRGQIGAHFENNDTNSGDILTASGIRTPQNQSTKNLSPHSNSKEAKQQQQENQRPDDANNQSKQPNDQGQTEGSQKVGKSKKVKGIAIGVATGVLLVLAQLVFLSSSGIVAVNPLDI